MSTDLTQEISVPLEVGDTVTIFEDVDVDSSDGFAAGQLFHDTVEQYAPQTGLLQFEDSDIGRAEFKELLDEGEGIQIV